MKNEIDYNYLAQNGITHLEDLVGKTLYFVFARQGIQSRKVRSIQFTEKTKEWFFIACETIRISEIGNTIFFSEDEAVEYQHSIMEQYTKEQQEKIALREEMQKKQDLNQLERLIKKYADFADECLKDLNYESETNNACYNVYKIEPDICYRGSAIVAAKTVEEANEYIRKFKNIDTLNEMDSWGYCSVDEDDVIEHVYSDVPGMLDLGIYYYGE